MQSLMPIQLSGDLMHHSIMAQRDQLLKAIDDNQLQEVQISMKAVSRIDSACLALMLDAMRYAQAKRKTLSYIDVPERLKKLATFCSLDHILHI